MGSRSLLQGIFLVQGSTQVSCIAGRFFTELSSLGASLPVFTRVSKGGTGRKDSSLMVT